LPTYIYMCGLDPEADAEAESKQNGIVLFQDCSTKASQIRSGDQAVALCIGQLKSKLKAISHESRDCFFSEHHCGEREAR
jgi:hypothetical protein